MRPTSTVTVFRVQASEDALDLLSRMIALDPARRISANAALQHRYFRSAPAPTPPAQMPRPALRVDTSLRQQLQVERLVSVRPCDLQYTI